MNTFTKPITKLVLLAILVSPVFMAGCSSSNVGVDPSIANNPAVIASIDNQALTLEEFETRYAQSVGDRFLAAQDSLPAYEDFLDRYIDFRLKVKYAEELGLDQDATLIQEIETYRDQLARPFLLEKEVIDPILMDIYEKQQYIIDASHILVRIGTSASEAELEEARLKMEAIRDSVMAGEEFGDLAFRNSDDPSARGNRRGGRGRLGYFSAGQMVKPFEDAAFSTPVDSVSRVFRSQFGYHILYVHEKKPSYPEVYISHIATRDGLRGLDDTTTAIQRIQDIKKRLDDGADFVELAKQESEDMETRGRGGQLGKITYTTPGAEAFRDAIFSLENPGDYTDITETNYGFHIFRMDERIPKKTFEESYDALKAQATRLPRLKKAEESMALKIREEVGFAVDSTLVMALLDGKAFNSNGIQNVSSDTLDMTILTFADSSYTLRQVVQFAETTSIPYNPDPTVMVNYTLEQFLNDQALNYEAARLESKDAEFARIMAEFEDGLLLFKLMEDSVWTAAAQDTVGLMAYHSPRADSFWFPERHRIISLRSRSDSTLAAITDRFATESMADVFSELVQDTVNVVRIDTTYIDGQNNSIFDKAIGLEKGSFTAPEFNSGSFIVMLNDGVEAARQKTFEEARSEVVNAYQTILEERLLTRLRTRYNAFTFKERLGNVFAEEKTGAEVSVSEGNMTGSSSMN